MKKILIAAAIIFGLTAFSPDFTAYAQDTENLITESSSDTRSTKSLTLEKDSLIELIYEVSYFQKTDYCDYVYNKMHECKEEYIEYVKNATSLSDLYVVGDDGKNNVVPYLERIQTLICNWQYYYKKTTVKSEADFARLKSVKVAAYSDSSQYTDGLNEYYSELYNTGYRKYYAALLASADLEEMEYALYDLNSYISNTEADDLSNMDVMNPTLDLNSIGAYPLGDWDQIDRNAIYSDDGLDTLRTYGEEKMNAYLDDKTEVQKASCQTIESAAVQSMAQCETAGDIIDTANQAIQAMIQKTGVDYTVLTSREKTACEDELIQYVLTLAASDYGTDSILDCDVFTERIKNCTYKEDAQYLLKKAYEYYSGLETLKDYEDSAISLLSKTYKTAAYDQTKVSSLLSEVKTKISACMLKIDVDVIVESYKANFKAAVRQFRISTTNLNKSYGTITGTQTIAYGGKTNVVVTAKKGYSIKSITVDGTKKAISNYQKMTVPFTNITRNHVVKVKFQKTVLYKVKTKKSGHGSITKTVSVRKGGKCTIKIVPAAGYKIASITVDKKRHKLTNKLTFKNVKKNHKVKVVFKK